MSGLVCTRKVASETTDLNCVEGSSLSSGRPPPLAPLLRLLSLSVRLLAGVGSARWAF